MLSLKRRIFRVRGSFPFLGDLIEDRLIDAHLGVLQSVTAVVPRQEVRIP